LGAILNTEHSHTRAVKTGINADLKLNRISNMFGRPYHSPTSFRALALRPGNGHDKYRNPPGRTKTLRDKTPSWNCQIPANPPFLTFSDPINSLCQQLFSFHEFTDIFFYGNGF
jgi:hypothetical protein